MPVRQVIRAGLPPAGKEPAPSGLPSPPLPSHLIKSPCPPIIPQAPRDSIIFDPQPPPTPVPDARRPDLLDGCLQRAARQHRRGHARPAGCRPPGCGVADLPEDRQHGQGISQAGDQDSGPRAVGVWPSGPDGMRGTQTEQQETYPTPIRPPTRPGQSLSVLGFFFAQGPPSNSGVGWRPTAVSCSTSFVPLGFLADPQIRRAGGFYLFIVRDPRCTSAPPASTASSCRCR